jgi:hypothetical protein
VDESGVIPRRHHHHVSPCSHITRGMNSRPVGGRSSEIVSPHHNQSMEYIASKDFLSNVSFHISVCGEKEVIGGFIYYIAY